MPWWGWMAIVIVIAVLIPIKMKIMKKMLTKKEESTEEE